MVTIIPTYFFAIEINPDLFLLWENYLVTKNWYNVMILKATLASHKSM